MDFDPVTNRNFKTSADYQLEQLVQIRKVLEAIQVDIAFLARTVVNAQAAGNTLFPVGAQPSQPKAEP